MLTLNNSLHFISRHFKQFSVPRVIISESDDLTCNAYYDWNLGSVIEIDDKEIYNENGLIVLSNDNNPLPVETLLLHEYRHHLQFLLNGRWHVPDWSNGESLDYYNDNCVYEIDSRLFEVSLGMIDEFTDEFKTLKVGRSHMLNLPTKSYLTSLNFTPLPVL